MLEPEVKRKGSNWVIVDKAKSGKEERTISPEYKTQAEALKAAGKMVGKVVRASITLTRPGKK
jgi:hypothetical protein